MKKTFIFTILGLFSISSQAAPAAKKSTPAPRPSYEVSCRAQAKEIAAQTYRTCITDNRTAEIEKLRKEYQEQIAALKQKYENEIKRAAGGTAVAASAPAAKAEVQEMQIELKPTAPEAAADESTMDIPEPIPVN